MKLPEECQHVWIANSGKGGSPDFRQNRQMSSKPLMHVLCNQCGARTWITREEWEKTGAEMSTDAGTPTPRTDVAHFQYGLSRDFMEFVKDLERELTALRTVHEAAQATIELLQKENGMQHTKLVAAQSKLATLLEAHNNLRADYQKARSECDGLRNPLVDANRCVHEMRDENKLHGHITDASAKWAYYIEPKIDAARKS